MLFLSLSDCTPVLPAGFELLAGAQRPRFPIRPKRTGRHGVMMSDGADGLYQEKTV
jgi:hypothetical protein